MPSLSPLKNRNNITATFTFQMIKNQADMNLHRNQKTANKGVQK